MLLNKCYVEICDLQRTEPVTVDRFNFGEGCFILSCLTLTEQGDRVRRRRRAAHGLG